MAEAKTRTTGTPDDHKANGKGGVTELEGFKVHEELARTPKGIVYKAVRVVEKDVVAVKAFRARLCDRKFVQNLTKNAENTFMLEHHGLVRSLGCSSDKNRVLLISEFASGEALSRKLKQRLPIPVGRALKIALQCAEALQHAAARKHFHGRLHPADIIVGEERVRIIGVGLGERPEHAAWTTPDPPLFEPLVYTAPEAMPSQPFPESPAGQAAADIYALGGILFHLLTGQPPLKGSDEAALLAEREAVKGPVEWPATVHVVAEVRSITDRMLAPEAGHRPSYEVLVDGLKQGILATERAEKGGVPAEGKAAYTGPRPIPVPHVPATAYLPPRPANPADFARKRDRESAPTYSTLILAVLTAIVFTYAMTKIYLYAPATPNGATPAAAVPVAQPPSTGKGPTGEAPVPQPVATPQPATPPVAPQPVAPASVPTGRDAGPTDPLVASRQLDLIEDMLKRGEVKHSPALLRVVKGLAEKLGKDTPNGMKAVILAAEIEETIVRNFTPATPATPAVTPAPAAAPTPVVQTPPTPEPVKTPAKFDAAEEEAKRREAREALASAVRVAMAKAAKFQYEGAKSELEKMAREGDKVQKKIAAEYATVIEQEDAFIQRCRRRLLAEIERSPRHESPLQVTRKNDPIPEDIIDFDDKGLKIASRKPGVKERFYEWDRVPPAQACNLLQNLADKKSLDDQLGMAAFCFNRGLTTDAELALETARGLPNAKEKADGLSEAWNGANALLK